MYNISKCEQREHAIKDSSNSHRGLTQDDSLSPVPLRHLSLNNDGHVKPDDEQKASLHDHRDVTQSRNHCHHASRPSPRPHGASVKGLIQLLSRTMSRQAYPAQAGIQRLEELVLQVRVRRLLRHIGRQRELECGYSLALELPADFELECQRSAPQDALLSSVLKENLEDLPVHHHLHDLELECR